MTASAINFPAKRRLLEQDLAQAKRERDRASLEALAGAGTKKALNTASAKVAELEDDLASLAGAEELHLKQEAARRDKETVQARQASAERIDEGLSEFVAAGSDLTEALGLVALALTRGRTAEAGILNEFHKWKGDGGVGLMRFSAVQGAFKPTSQADVIVGFLERSNVNTGNPNLRNVFEGRSFAEYSRFLAGQVRANMTAEIPELAQERSEKEAA